MKHKQVRIAPSILAADWSRIGEESTSVLGAGADWLHLDVMDGHFVPPITFGPDLVEAVKRSSSAFCDVHLMIEHPERQIDAFAQAGADLITVHQEACPHLHRVVQQIKELGLKAGVALNPATPVAGVEAILPSIDLLLIMTVNPGWGGQKFIPDSPRRIAEAAELIARQTHPIHLEVDGGINEETAKQVISAGADVLVAGTYIFKQDGYEEAIRKLRGI